MSGSHLSKDFFELVKAIGESKSKQVQLLLQLTAVMRKWPACVESSAKVPPRFCMATVLTPMLFVFRHCRTCCLFSMTFCIVFAGGGPHYPAGNRGIESQTCRSCRLERRELPSPFLTCSRLISAMIGTEDAR